MFRLFIEVHNVFHFLEYEFSLLIIITLSVHLGTVFESLPHAA